MKKKYEANFFKTLISIVAICLCLISVNSYAVDEINTGFFSSTAIKGYDTVAYFTQDKAVKGNKKYQFEWKGAKWHFSSQNHLDLFTSSPSKYAPQYGGWCAYAVSQNSTASIEPDLFTIVNGKLYLNYNREVNKKWLGNQSQYIDDADKYWPNILGK
jgi:YHS domain-containing protein